MTVYALIFMTTFGIERFEFNDQALALGIYEGIISKHKKLTRESAGHTETIKEQNQ